VIKVHGSDILRLSLYPRRGRGTVEALHGAAAIVVVSQDLKERVVELGVNPQRIQVIYDGVDSARFHPGPQAEARARLAGELQAQGPVVLYVGNLVPVKGLEVLIEALARLTSLGVDYQGFLIGQGPLRSRLEHQIARRGLGGRVHLLGSRPHDRLPDWYRAADLLVLPSYSEGVPTVLLEAAACGTPFVATRVGGIPEIAHLGTSRLIRAGDAEALAQAIRISLAERPQPGPRDRATVRTYADAVSELVEVFEQVRTTRVPASLVPAAHSS
jgi:glycosyltransferase involved in cell wall biosynthesis